MAYMFDTFLKSLPKNRLEFVNDLEIPDDIRLTTDVDADLDDVWTINSDVPSDSLVSGSFDDCLFPFPKRGSASTESSVSLSRAMTDSEIDYDRYRRLMNRRISDPFGQMREALDRFPPEYLASLESFQYSSPERIETPPTSTRPIYNDELELKMRKFFDEECHVWTPDDPGLLDLEEALQSLDLKVPKYWDPIWTPLNLDESVDSLLDFETELFRDGIESHRYCVKCNFNGNDLQHYDNRVSRYCT